MNISVNKYLPALVESAMKNDKRGIRMATSAIIRTLTKESDKATESMISKLKSLLGDYEIGKLASRGSGTAELIRPQSLPNRNNLILNSSEQLRISDFIRGIENSDLLLKNGVPPANSLLLYGRPGVGKTSIATEIANRLNLPLLSVNLSELISSFLGSTGKNISKLIEQAQLQPSVLFFDEFDAIASERNTENDVAELRRIVNVLLIELDSWPTDSVVIAATNHPEMIDSAIWRRFRICLEIQLPDVQQRIALWNEYLNTPDVHPNKNFISSAISSISISPAIIRNISLSALQKTLIDDTPIELSLTEALINSQIVMTRQDRIQLMSVLNANPLGYTHRQIAGAFNLTHTTVGRYLREEKSHGSNK